MASWDCFHTTSLPQEEAENAALARQDDPSLDQTRSQQQQQTQRSGTGDNAAVGRDQSWGLREKLLEAEIDALKRWKLNRQLEDDRARLRDFDATDACTCRGGQQKVAKRRKKLGAPSLRPTQSSGGEGSGLNWETTLLQRQQENSTENIMDYKHRLLGHFDVMRRNQFFLELVTTSKKQVIGKVEVPTSLWNLSMTLNLIQAVKEATAMLCSPSIQFDLSGRVYLHTMDAVHEYMREPFFTRGQNKDVLQVLESSWEQIVFPTLAAPTQPHTETLTTPPSGLPIARFSVAVQHQINQQQQHQGEAYQTRCLGGLLCILLRAVVQALDAILQSNPPPNQQQQYLHHDQVIVGDGEGRFARRTRQVRKNKAAERVERTQNSLANRQIQRQRQQQQEERCGQLVEIACGLLSAYRQSSSSLAELLEWRRERRRRSGNSDSDDMDESHGSANTSSSNSSAWISSVDADELKRVQDDCNRLMSSICSIALFSSDVPTTTAAARPPRSGISAWLTQRIQRLVSIDCFH
ncbi:hypothetical protein BGZ47_007329 [Haplosporangium gracile]|nr:hypothetical protein BGZ47_007329 [Haplosporangium gracile]